MKITDFNFLPAAYDRIIYVHEGHSVMENGIGSQDVVYTNGVGFFIPIVIMSLDQENWYSTEFPPQDDAGVQLMSGSTNVYGDRFTFAGYINGSQYQTGTYNIYYKLLGIEL